MFIDSNLIAYDFMTDFNGPDRQYPNPYYPAGIYDADKSVYKYGPPSNEYPSLALPCDLYDLYGNVIPAGFYTATVDTERKNILLYKGSDLVAKVQIFKIVEKMYDNDEINKERELEAKVEEAIRKKKLKKQREAQEALDAYRDLQKSQSYANIEDTGKGYYVINYNHKGIKATGAVKK